jgi:ribonuclease HI
MSELVLRTGGGTEVLKFTVLKNVFVVEIGENLGNNRMNLRAITHFDRMQAQQIITHLQQQFNL